MRDVQHVSSRPIAGFSHGLGSEHMNLNRARCFIVVYIASTIVSTVWAASIKHGKFWHI